MKGWNSLNWILLSMLLYDPASAFEIGVGASVSKKYLNVFNESGAELAGLEGDSGLWPYLSIKTEDKYFGDTSFGYFYYGWYTQDAVDKVKDHADRVLPSRVNLAFLYAGATVFYAFGNKLITSQNGQSQHAVGIGAGWGASKIYGTIPAEFTNTGLTEAIDSNLTGTSVNIFYRYLWGEMFLMFDASTVQVKNGNRRYDTTESSFTLGHYFDF
jgi:hypothetical protein